MNKPIQFIKIVKKTNGKIEQAKCIIGMFCLLSDIKLSDAELTVLAYFAVYKDNTKVKEFIIKGNILKTEDSLKNTISKLKRAGLLKKSTTNKEYSINDRLNFTPEPVIGFLIKVDNQ